MATTYIVVVDTQQSYILSDGDTVFVGQGATLYSTFPVILSDVVGGVPQTNQTIMVDGSIVSTGNIAIWLRAPAAGIGAHSVSIGPEGTVRSPGNFSAILMDGSHGTFTNAGHVVGGAGFLGNGWGAGTFQNTGHVLGQSFYAVQFVDSATTTVTNSGTLQGAGGLVLQDSSLKVLNSGDIVSNSATVAAVDAGAGASELVLRNSGHIAGQGAAIQGSVAADLVTNSGTIDGDVLLAEGNDLFRGRHGTLWGDIHGGGGHDTISGGAGEQSIRGGGGNDRLAGDADDDFLQGDAGSDRFVFARNGGDDRVIDFTNGTDRLDLNAFHRSFSAFSSAASDAIGGMLLNLTAFGGGTVFLAGFSKAQFDATDVLL
jgi:Ca2+-binding RTX toxin-like protein